jgi:hypothetical protein
MAQKVHIVLEDDIDGGPADETVTFALDGTSYEIDLSAKNAKGLRDAFARYVGAGRRTTSGGSVGHRGRGRGRSRASVDRAQLQNIREWARKSGHRVSERGRISSEVMAAYQDAHK